MSESFVDLSYRGLALGKRIKLTQVRQTAGYLEMPTPMPVGTMIGIATEDGALFEAMVAEVHEQVGGSDKTPGMLIKPTLEAEAARTWWKQRVTVVETEKPLPQPDAEGRVTVTARPKSDTAVPELVDDGRNTAVIEVIDERVAAESALEASDSNLPRISDDLIAQNPIVDDGKRTMMMPVMDLEALGLDPSATNQMPAITDDEPGDTGNGDKPESKSKKKRKKR